MALNETLSELGLTRREAIALGLLSAAGLLLPGCSPAQAKTIEKIPELYLDLSIRSANIPPKARALRGALQADETARNFFRPIVQLQCDNPTLPQTGTSLKNEFQTFSLYVIPKDRLQGLEVARSPYWRDLLNDRLQASFYPYKSQLGLRMGSEIADFGAQLPGYVVLNGPIDNYRDPTSGYVSWELISREIRGPAIKIIKSHFPGEYFRFHGVMATNWTAPSNENPGNGGRFVPFENLGEIYTEELTLHPDYELPGILVDGHEGGHALSLDHSSIRNSLMNHLTLYNGEPKSLFAETVKKICEGRLRYLLPQTNR